MSRIVEIVVAAQPAEVHGLQELFVTFGEATTQLTPRTFLFMDTLRLTLRHPPAYVINELAHILPTTSMSLVLDEQLVLEWSAGRLPDSVSTLLERLFVELPTPYAAIVELGSGEGLQRLIAVPLSVFAIVDQVIRNDTSHDVTVVLVQGAVQHH